jgi:peptidylprolyl isomerase
VKRGSACGRILTALTTALLALGLSITAAAQAQETESPDPANWRKVDPARMFILDTTKGRIIIETAPEFAPNHVARFSLFARTGFYDGLKFHRVIDDFMVQGGDPKGDGSGGSGSTIDAEFYIMRDASLPVVEISDRLYNRGGFWHGMPVITQPIAQASVRADGKVEAWLSHCAGVVSTARQGSQDPAEDRRLQNSADSQFFIMRYSARADGTPNTFLDQKYTAWGRVVWGQDVVRAMNVGEVGQNPGFEPDTIITAKIGSDLPEDEQPEVWVMREDGPQFAALIDQMTQENGGEPPDVCDVTVPTQLVAN